MKEDKLNKCLNCGNKTVNEKFCSISCENKYYGQIRANNKYGNFKEFTVFCFKCGVKMITNEREFLFPKKEKYFCSISCANTRVHTKESRKKISDTILRKELRHDDIEKECEFCEKKFIIDWKHRRQKFCSKKCSARKRIEDPEYKTKLVEFGKKSAKIRAEEKRSKNEKLFASLCEEKFNKVLTNKPIFNGWDADVIIEDLKIAVLWNGKWHYEKITEKHSVKQVQNRDKIKIKEIKKTGYKSYIIKDMGKYNEEFVKTEFLKFLKKYKIK